MELIDLSKHARDPKYYNRDRDIETALAWNAVKNLSSKQDERIFSSILRVWR